MRRSRFAIVGLVIALGACGPSKGAIASYVRRNTGLITELHLDGSTLNKVESQRYGGSSEWGVRTTQFHDLASTSPAADLLAGYSSQLARSRWRCAPGDPIPDAPSISFVSCRRGSSILVVGLHSSSPGHYSAEITADWRDRVQELNRG